MRADDYRLRLCDTINGDRGVLFSMKTRTTVCLVATGLIASAVLQAQGGPPPANKEAAVSNVPFSRILNSSQEPQNWLTYSGSLSSQRYSELKQIAPDNVKDLSLKWVFQSRSLEKHEVTPLVVDGVMYTVQGINDVFALDAATGRTLWSYSHKPGPDARNCCGQE